MVRSASAGLHSSVIVLTPQEDADTTETVEVVDVARESRDDRRRHLRVRGGEP